MKYPLAFLTLILAYGVALGQNTLTDTSATCVAYWQNGETKVYRVHHKKEKHQGAALQTEIDYHYEAHLRIVDSTAEGYTIEWVNKNFSSTPENPTVQGMNLMFRDLKFLYKTDDLGAFRELTNWEEVRDFYVGLAEFSIPKDDTGRMVMDKTRALFATREQVEAVLIPVIQLFHIPFGYEYTTRKQVSQTEVPNIFGGDPIPALNSARLTDPRPKATSFTVVFTQAIDRASMALVMKDAFKTFGGENPYASKEIQKAMEGFDMSDTREFKVVAGSGWIQNISFHQVISVRGVRKVESYQVEATE